MTVTRFAPSPTGYIHVGNLRTALMNYLIARKTGGTFILRLDDTDQERSKQEYIDALKQDLEWLGIEWDREERQSLRLDRYAEVVCDNSRIFAGIDRLLAKLEDAERPWGVVTNKPEYLTHPLLDALGLASRSACIVGGDTLPVRKPDPAPLVLACDMAGVEPHRTVYVGDALRDIEAGLAAGMATIAAGYGYITEDDDPQSWGADVIAADTEELAQIVLKAVNLGTS